MDICNPLGSSKNRMTALFEHSSESTLIINPDATLKYVSPSVKRILGYSSEELIGKSIFNYIKEDEHANAMDEIQHLLGNYGRTTTVAITVRHKNGSWRIVECTKSNLLDDPAINGIVANFHDVTEFKQLEENLRDAIKTAEAANVAKMEFLANMSHEIRTPMNAVVGLTHILKNTAPLTDKQEQFLNTLQDSADSLLELINDMLDFARVEGNQVHLENIKFNLRQLVEKAIGMVSVKAQNKELSLSIDYSDDLPKEFIGDPYRIQQILINLISNAVKFTEKGSVKVQVSGLRRNRHISNVTIQVIDTGIGIEKEKYDIIFDQFTQANSSTTRKYGGSGLGLAICRSLAEKMSGSVTVSSIVGEGSTFTVMLPLYSNIIITENTVTSLPAPPPAPEKPTQKKHVLLVEDYHPNILVAITLLEQFGCSHEVAKNGIEALSRFKAATFDLILMDIQMQDMDGFEATRLIRSYEQQNAMTPTPIIAVTAHALSGDRERCLQVGMDDYIAKPFNPVELQKMIQASSKQNKPAMII